MELEKYGTLVSKPVSVELPGHQTNRARRTAFQEELGALTMLAITDLTVQTRLSPGLLADEQEVLLRNMNIAMILMTNLLKIAIHLDITLEIIQAIRMDI